LFIIIIVILDAGYKTQAKQTGTTTTIEKKIVLGRIVLEKTVLEEAKESPE